MNKTVIDFKGASPLKRALKAVKEMGAKLEELERSAKEPIAIVGIGCRFPGNANTPEELWRLLRDGRDAITRVSSDRWDVDGYYDPNPDAIGKMYTQQGGMLTEIDKFEPQFFGISPREAAGMDPQQRLLLEVTWEALERAGQAPQKLVGSQTGVFIGISSSDYATILSQSGDPSLIDAYTGTGVALSMAAGRISYVLGLQGPSVVLDTACSSSLVAVHTACQSLRTKKCRIALAGGANLILSPAPNVYLSKVRAISPDSRCKTFDVTADGYGRGEGCAMVVLKRLSDALANGDPILALIRGSAINHDGRTSGLTVPSSRAQQAVIREALANACAEPLQISYIEAHGTGTPLGDPIELESLSAVLCEGRAKNQKLLVGSLKTNLGHLEAAAGIAGLIKVVLALQHKEIPPHLHMKIPNPRFAWETEPIRVPISLTPWVVEHGPRIAGVSSFGFSGTNAHVVMEEASQDDYKNSEFDILELPADRPIHILKMSARSEGALRQMGARFEKHLGDEIVTSVANICYTANVGRSDFAHRIAFVCKSKEQLREYQSAIATGRTVSGMYQGVVQSGERQKVVFLFTGQGSQYVGMGRQLYVTQPTFRKALDRCSELLHADLPQPLLSVLYPEPGNSSLLNETAYAQPALFAFEYALATLWYSWGIEPSAVMGHGVGEYVAACIAGVFSLEDGLKLVAVRGRLMQNLTSKGAMAVIFADGKRVADWIRPFSETISIAAINSPDNLVISGVEAHLQTILEKLHEEGISATRLDVSRAFHSPLMDPMLDEFEKIASEMKYSAPRISLISGVNGKPVRDGELVNAAYWRQHVREPVQFQMAMRTLSEQGYKLFIEVGPNPVLSDMGSSCIEKRAGEWLPSLRKGQDDWLQLLETLAYLYVCGVEIDWDRFDRDYTRRRVILPTYPFQRERYWIEETPPGQRKIVAPRVTVRQTAHPLLGYRLRTALKETLFESSISSHSPPLLSDHRIYGKVVVPGAFHVSLILSAVREVFGHGPHVLKDVSFLQPIIFSEDESRTVQVILRPGDPGLASFEIFSVGAEGKEEIAWTLHSTGRIDLEKTDSAVLTSSFRSSGEILSRCQENKFFASSFYQKVQEAGLQLGPSFQWLGKIWQGNGEAIAFLQRPETVRDVALYQMYPGLIDACFQLIGAALPKGEAVETVFVPVGFREFRFYGCPDADLMCHVILSSGDWLNHDALVADVHVFAEDGKEVAEIESLYLKRAPREAILRVAPERYSSWLYEIEWQLKARAESNQSAEQRQFNEPSNWLIFADRNGIGEGLAVLLEKHGENCVMVFPGEGYSHLGDSRYQVNPLRSEDFQLLIKGTFGQSGPPCRKIVYLWGLDSQSSEAMTVDFLDTTIAMGCSGVLSLIQTLAAIAESVSPRLWLVTQGAQAVERQSISLSVAQAPLWGLGRVIALELPAMWGGLVDLDPAYAEDNVGMLLQEIWQPEVDDNIAFRRGLRYVARLQRSTALKMMDGSFSLNTGGTYLITGGLGALGFEVANWMVERGARNLVLIGRTSASGDAAEAITKMEASGAHVVVINGDISREKDVAHILAQINQSMPPLRGIVHAAGVLEDGILLQQDWQRFARVLAPKVNGTWILHTLTQGMDLDFFVLFSSGTSLLGNAGQGNYAAANAFLDVMAHYRRTMGLPALSINWGAWGEVGMASLLDRRNQLRMASSGTEFISRDQGLHILEKLLQRTSNKVDGGVAQIGVLPIDWQTFYELNPAIAKLPLLANVVGEDVRSIGLKKKRGLTKEVLSGAKPEERHHLLEAYLAQIVAEELMSPLSDVDLKHPLPRLGFDSLMAVRAKNKIESDLSIVLPVVEFLQEHSINILASLLLEKFDLNLSVDLSAQESNSNKPVDDARNATSTIDPEEALSLLGKIDELTDDQINSILDKMSSEKGES